MRWTLQLGIFIFELLMGKSPFSARTIDASSKKILEGKLKFADSVGSKAKDLITKLLHTTPNKRLGAKKKEWREIKGESSDDALPHPQRQDSPCSRWGGFGRRARRPEGWPTHIRHSHRGRG